MGKRVIEEQIVNHDNLQCLVKELKVYCVTKSYSLIKLSYLQN